MMTSSEVLQAAQEKMDRAVNFFKNELLAIRAGRANPHILDHIRVNYYGTPTPVAQVGNISAPEPRLLVIAPWDVSLIKEIEKAIQTSDLGINPQNDGKIIRLLVPELTQERRKELVKNLKKRGEDAKVTVRAIRREANDQLKAMEKDHTISEDDLKRDEAKMQKTTDQYIKTIDDITKDKEKEIMEV